MPDWQAFARARPHSSALEPLEPREDPPPSCDLRDRCCPYESDESDESDELDESGKSDESDESDETNKL